MVTRALQSTCHVLVWLILSSLAACWPSPTTAPITVPTSAPAAVLPTATSPVIASPEPSPTQPPSPTATSAPAPPTAAPVDVEGLLAWTVAADAAVYVLDADHVLHHLSPGDLIPLARSPALFESDPQATAYLLASERYLFAGTSAISQTLVLDRSDLGLVGQLEGFGPMALGPGRRLLMIPQGIEEAWPFGNFEIWAYDLNDLTAPPDRVLRTTGASMDDLAIDPASRRLLLLTSNVNASPPHRGQTYEIYSLDSLERLAGVEWERGSLTRPVFNPRTGEIVGSRIGLNWTRRLLVAGTEGKELRNRQSVDGQPAIDTGGAWIYLLRQRGLWVLRADDLSLQSVSPFSETPPQDLALSPDGETLYLFGNGWLSARSTAELRSLGLAPVSPIPAVWFSAEPASDPVQPRLYPSPQMDEDGVLFVQLVGGIENVLETYRSTDGGQSWHLLPSLLEPDLAAATFLSLSPDFARDRTLTALVGSVFVRSTDGGASWQPWQPRIAFASDRDGNREIYTMDRDGQDVQRLTESPAEEENPAWSPGWTRIAFQSNRNGNWDIYTMRVDCDPQGAGAEERCDLRQLTADPADDLLPAWSPDGRTITFVSTRDGNPEIYVMDSQGGTQHRLTFTPTGDWRPAWRSDSTHLVFASDRGGNNDIYQLAVPDLAAGPLAAEPEIVPVITGPADDRDPAVVAGLVERLLFLSDRDGLMRTYVFEPNAQPRPFAETDQPEAHPAVLPGEYYAILVSSERGGTTDIYQGGFSGYAPLSPSPGFDGHPAGGAVAWRPDTAASLAWLLESVPASEVTNLAQAGQR
jgi:hypothetical protein